MSKRILIVLGHPDPAPDRYCRALAKAYADGARSAGHAVDEIDLAHLAFPLLRTIDEFNAGHPPPMLEPAAAAFKRAEHVVFVFPLWLGTMPALLKAFLEQIMRPGVAFEVGGRGFPKKLLRGRSGRIIVTMGMPAAMYRWWYLDRGLAGMRRSILAFVGISPVKETLFGLVETVSDAKRRRWLEHMAELGRSAA